MAYINSFEFVCRP